MKFIRQFLIILAVSFVGELLNYFIPLPIPASIYGLVLMLICLQRGIIPLEAVRETGKFLVEIMPLMFVPAAVGLLESWEVLRPVWMPVIAVTVISTVVVIASAGSMTQFVIGRWGSGETGGADGQTAGLYAAEIGEEQEVRANE